MAGTFLRQTPRFAARFILAAALPVWLFVSPARAECGGENGGTSVVTALHDGEILILDDGRTVRLAGVLTPKRAADGPLAEARAMTENALAALVVGKQVELRLNGKTRDRYGRLLAQAFVVNGAERVWVQGKLAGDGLARVISSWDSRACVHELLEKENSAREAHQGLWGKGYFAVRPAESEALLAGLARSYEIVEGQVQSITQMKGRAYINFGQNWRQDFTAFVSEKSVRLFENPGGTTTARSPAGGAAAVDGAGSGANAAPTNASAPESAEAAFGGPPDAPDTASHAMTPAATGATATPAKFDFARLKGQRVRVRGWIENFNGPSISVTHPEQIEIVSAQIALPR